MNIGLWSVNMTQTTATVFEKYQVRKTKKQKADFRDYVTEVARENGYSVKTENGYLGAKNIVVGNPESAKVVYTAHYDTCPRLPFPNFITPKNIFIYLLYSLALVVAFMIIGGAIGFVIGFFMGMLSALLNFEFPSALIPFIAEIPIIAILLLILIGPANKHTANDNTSGVTALLDIMLSLPDGEKEKAAFIFFDLEEVGLFGSAGFASKHPSVRKNKLLINFDCISDGKNFLLVVKKSAVQHKQLLEECFAGNENITVEVLDKGVFYPSDQANFKCGVGVAALKKAKNSNLLYMNRIHTKRDVIYQEENIEFIKNGAVELVKKI